MAYPVDNTALPSYAGTALQGDIDHAGWHGTTNTDLDGVKTVLGTTAGTSIAKSMTAGDFIPVKATGAEINTGTEDSKFTTPKAIADSNVAFTTDDALTTGWIPSGETWVFGAIDAPSFTFTIAAFDATAKYSVGMRVKLTNASVKYFIITAVTFDDPGSTITVYGGTDYALVDAAITLPFYSTQKAPHGFPLSPAKWTVETTNTSFNSQASPTQDTWYNLGTVNISVPIGVWKTMFEVWVQGVRDSADTVTVHVALSTANNSASDGLLLGGGQVNNVINVSQTVHRERILTLSSKTPYYLNTRTPSAGIGTIYNRGDLSTIVIRAVCAYL